MSGGLSLSPQAFKKSNSIFSGVSPEVKHSVGVLSGETKSVRAITGISSFIQALQNRYTHKDYAYLKRLLYDDTFPISESFINLALVKEEEQKAKEKEVKEAKSDSKEDEKSSRSVRDEVLLFYETLHAPKEKIELSELLSPQKGESKEAPKRLLVEGRAGIGKTTLCQYLAYQWAVGEKDVSNPLKGWPKPFSAVIWLPLRRLNEYKDSDVNLPRVVYRECLLEEDQQRLSVEDIGIYLKQLEETHEVLYLLDGYDELDVKEAKDSKEGKAYQSLLSSLWNKEWCIVTTRPYYVSNNTLWPEEQYRRLENIGFVDENVKAYVKRFFQDFKEEKRGEAVLQSFERYPMIKGLGHVPILLELICSVWKEKLFKEEAPDTLTHLYQEVTQCLLKRYLQRQQEDVSLLTSSEIEEHPRVRGPLSFLEELAWKGMQQQELILKPRTYSSLIQTHCPHVKDRALFLETVFKHLGFLKGVGEPKSSLMQQEYYFIHLTFQEFFAARYLVNSLKEPSHSKRYGEALQFIRDNKYHPRYLIMLSFTAGLLRLSSKTKEDETFIHRFWDTLTSEPYDLTGAGHLRLTMACLEEAHCDERITQCKSLLKEVQDYLETRIKERTWRVDFPGNLLLSYQTHVGIIRHLFIRAMLVNGLRSENKTGVIEVLGAMRSAVAIPEVLRSLLACLSDKDGYVRSCATDALGGMGSAAATPEILKGLLVCLSDKEEDVRASAVSALGRIGSAAATLEILKALLVCLNDKDGDVRRNAAYALGEMGSSAATLEVLKDLLVCLNDKEEDVRSYAVSAFGRMGNAGAMPEVLKGLLICLSDKERSIKSSAASALGEIGSTSGTPEVLKGLLVCLSDEDVDTRIIAASALGKIGVTAATPEVLRALLVCLSDEEEEVRTDATVALRSMGNAAATPEVLEGLLIYLSNKEQDIRSCAAEALRMMGNAAAIPEVLKGLLVYLGNKEEHIRSIAAYVFGRMGSTAATPEVLKGLLVCLSDKVRYVRSRAAYAFGEIGSAAATPEVLKGLLARLSDTEWDVRSSAVYALGKMGSGILTSEMMRGLLVCLSDEEEDVRFNAASALRGIGAAAETPPEVLKGLLTYLSKDSMNSGVIKLISPLNWPFSVLVTLEASSVNLLLNNRGEVNDVLSFTPLLELMKVYFQTGYIEWVPIIAGNAIKKGVAVTLNQDSVLILDSQGSSSVPFPSEKRNTLLGPLIQAFCEQAKKEGLPVYYAHEHLMKSSVALKELKTDLSLQLQFPQGDHMSAHPHPELKSGVPPVTREGAVLTIDFKALQQTCSRISHQKVREEVGKLLRVLEEKALAFNEDVKDKIIELRTLVETLSNIQSIIKSKMTMIASMGGDKDSGDKARNILKWIEDAIRGSLHYLKPETPSSMPQVYWQENRLRLEQQLLVGESKLSQEFIKTLRSIESKGSRYQVPESVFICYAWPDEEETHLKWVQPFLKTLRIHLREAGIAAKLDIEDGKAGGNIYGYMEGSESQEYVLVMGTETLVKKHKSGVKAVCTELNHINRKREVDQAAKRDCVFPILISGDYRHSFPAGYERYMTVTDWLGGNSTYCQYLQKLIASLYGTQEKAFEVEWKEFFSLVQGGERAGIVEPLSQRAVIAKMEAEKIQREEEEKQQERDSRKVLGVSAGDAKGIDPSASSSSSSVGFRAPSSSSAALPGLSDAQLVARQRHHDSAFGTRFMSSVSQRESFLSLQPTEEENSFGTEELLQDIRNPELKDESQQGDPKSGISSQPSSRIASGRQ